MNLISRFKTGWTLLKFVRVGLGGLILYSAAESGQVSGMVLGGLFIMYSLLTDGVCGGGGACYRPEQKKTTDKPIVDEELDLK